MVPTAELSSRLDQLSSWDTGPYPVISLYLNLQPDDRGRDRFQPFLRHALSDRLATYQAESPERASLTGDVTRIQTYLEHLDPAANGLALFASSGAGLFEALELAAPVQQHHLSIADAPHLYPLARLLDEYPRYAVLVADTQTARLMVIAANSVERAQSIEGARTKRHKMGGWSQARYQRHVDQLREQHLKEAAEMLTRVVRDEQIPSVLLGGEDVTVARLKDELPQDVVSRLVDELRVSARSPENEILQSVMDAARRQDAQSDRERVDALLDAFRSGGLAVVGVEPVKRALELGQVQELVIAGTAESIDAAGHESASGDARSQGRSGPEQMANELVVKARQTAASLRFIEDAALLAPFGGVGAFLRFAV